MTSRNFKPVAGAILLVGSLSAFSAHADGLYAGGGLGTPHYPDSVNGIDANGTSLSGKLFAGYQVTPNFALEAGVADLGRVSNGTGRVDGRSEYLDAVGIAPLSDKWSLLGSVGVAHINLDTTGGDASDNGLKLGLGAQYALTSNVSLRGQVERYQPKVFGEKPNIDQYTFGVRVGF